MPPKNILNSSFEEVSSCLKSLGEKTFRSKQIFDWIYKKNVREFGRMKNLPQGLREKLGENFLFPEIVLLKELSSRDGTKKYLFELDDHEKIESVLIPTEKRATICVSTQVGCKFACRFCASGLGGFKRDLSCAEILGQILKAKELFTKRSITHVVFMGVGEPLDNYQNVLKSIHILNDKRGLNIAARRITISTCGLVPEIRKLSDEGIQLELSVSLHGHNDQIREHLMPVNKKYPLNDLISACKDYCKKTKRQVTFEYLLIDKLTDTEEAALKLKRLLRGLICKINLIPYNTVSEFDLHPPSRQKCLTFKRSLERQGVHSTLRRSRGDDVSAACGQLRRTPIK